MLRVLPPTTLATNKIAASWVNTNFRLGKITGVGTPYTEVTSLAAKQVCFGPVKAQQGTTCRNFGAKCGTILYFVQQLFTTCSNLICCKDIGIPSVFKDYGFALRLEVLQKRLWWLERPIREWKSLPYSEQMWSVAGLSAWFQAFLVCLFVCSCSESALQKQRGLAALLASKLNVLKQRFPIRWCQCPRLSGPSRRHLYSVIGAWQWGDFLEVILHKGNRLGSSRPPFSQHGATSPS